jgi:hypothetical protein
MAIEPLIADLPPTMKTIKKKAVDGLEGKECC